MLWRRAAKCLLWKAARKWKAKEEDALGGDVDDDYLYSGMTWADKQWLFSDDTEKLVYF